MWASDQTALRAVQHVFPKNVDRLFAVGDLLIDAGRGGVAQR
jgi:hypothetical protein